MGLTGDRIRELRQRNRMTLDDVARHLGVGRQAIYKYEQGTVTNIPLENLEKMAQLFGTTPGYLAGWSDVQPVVDHSLNSHELRLVSAYRAADDRARDDALKTLLDHPRKKSEPSVI